MATTLDDLAGEDIIDSRDLIARLQELEDAADEEPSDLGCASCGEGSMPNDKVPSLCVECGDELVELRELDADNGIADWQYGETLIRESYFTEHAMQLADDIGAINADSGWPTAYIDWEQAADALKTDYTTLEIRGITYYAR